MDESSKKSYTNAFIKREPEDNNLEGKLNLVIETMQGMDARVQRMEAKVDLLVTKADLPDKKIPFKTDFNTAAYPPPKIGISGGGDDQTIIVKGFDPSLPEMYIKSLLSNYFSSCGEVTSVIVPTDRETSAIIGCAYIHLKEGVEKALKLNGSYLGGWKLLVEKASPIRDANSGFGPSGRGGRFSPSGRGGRIGPSGRGGRFGTSAREGQWPYPYRCNGLGHCAYC